MELINDQLLGQPLRLEGNMAGWQRLYWAGQPVSQLDASSEAEGERVHQFTLQSERGDVTCEVAVQVQWQPFLVRYSLKSNGQLLSESERSDAELMHSTPEQEAPVSTKFGIAGLASLGFKLLKSAKAFKAILAVGSLAAYSWLFSLPFALALLFCLVVHEYGHIRAMKYFGMKTKGIYLIPFVGGAAVSDSKLNTRWQQVVISIMGPTWGMVLSWIALIGWWATDATWLAALAGFNAILNLFNLLPILPLDGGHILKSITFSMHDLMGLILCMAGAAIGVYLCYTLGLPLLGFLLGIGSFEIATEWRNRQQSFLLPLDRYGQVVSVIWYALTVAALIGVVMILAASGDELLSLPKAILSS